MVKGFVFLREGYFGLPEPDLRLNIDTLTVNKPKRERHSRHVEGPDYNPLRCEKCEYAAKDIDDLAQHISSTH
jgi:hypothetical protein